jgi:hypothetical protein
MASRSSTGVIVALVVFVVLSVALLAVSIILYADKSAAEQSASEARADLEKYISSTERDTTETKDMLGKTSGSSLYGFMVNRDQEVAAFVSGNRAADLAAMKDSLKDLKLGESDTVKDGVRKLAQDRDARKAEAEALKAKSADLAKELESLKAQLASSNKQREEAMAKLTASIGTYQSAAESYRTDFEQAKADLDRARADLQARFASESEALQAEIDALRSERGVLDGRIAALQKKVDSTSTKAGNPAALVDANVIDFDPKTGNLFIDIGMNKRVVPGMTFEVFDDAAGIAASAASADGTRGKASIQVTKVGDKSSTCRVLRGSASRPVVKGDVVANAVFNPEYKFKFLVHGKFDANGDGKATAAESDFVKSRILEWGGEVVEGDALSGDLDFLVLGVQPPMPPELPSDATEAQTMAYTSQRAARELYDTLFQTAADAEIPVLNWGRFETLTGSVNR